MTKNTLGLKRLCAKCGTRYYDMKKKKPACPKCGTAFDPDALVRARKKHNVPEQKKIKKEDLDAIEDVELDDNDSNLIEDVDELGDDGDVDVVIDLDDDERDS